MHYELYIDLFFLENFMMDSLLLFVTERITGGKYSFKGVLSGAFLGSVSDGVCICSRLDEKHSLLSGDSILYALVKK